MATEWKKVCILDMIKIIIKLCQDFAFVKWLNK